MKKTLISACLMTLALLAGTAQAANADCQAQASKKKLAGAAKTSFMKKCEKSEKSEKSVKSASGAASGAKAKAKAKVAASPACEKSATDKKLAGAAAKSHIKKCMADSKK